jgi:hypothetical protein
MDVVIGWIILLAIIGAIVWAVRKAVLYVKYRNSLSNEEKSHLVAVKQAEKRIKKAERDYDSRVTNARKAIASAQAGQEVAKFRTKEPQPAEGSWKEMLRNDAQTFLLTGTTVKLPSGTHALTPNVKAQVDTAGNLVEYATGRTTLTRMGVGAVIAGPLGLMVGMGAKKSGKKTRDVRELYIMIEGDDWADTLKVHADEGQKARAFAQQVNVAARNVERASAEQEQAIRKARQHLTTAERDRTAIEVAHSQRRALDSGRAPDGAIALNA